MIRTIARKTTLALLSVVMGLSGLTASLFLTSSMQDAQMLPHPKAAYAQTLDVQSAKVISK